MQPCGGGADGEGRTKDGMVQVPTLVFRVRRRRSRGFIAAWKIKSSAIASCSLPHPYLWDKTMRRIDTQICSIITCGFASLIQRARANGDFDVPQSRLSASRRTCRMNTSCQHRALGLDLTDVESMTVAYIKTYQQIPIILKFFRKTFLALRRHTFAILCRCSVCAKAAGLWGITS